MPRPLIRLASLAAAAAAALLALPAHAGARLPCSEVRVFPDAAINALVMPYRSEKDALDPKSAASRLSALVQQELLFSMLKYGSVAATELTGEPDRCDVRQVIERINRPGPNNLRRGHGLLVIWGRIYEDRGDLYVQSYLRFLRAGTNELLQTALGEDGAKLELAGRLAAQGAALAPRKVTRQDFAEIERRAREALVMRSQPKEGASATALAPNPAEPLGYSVIEARGDWMRIRAFADGRTGWVRARVDTPQWSLRRFLPEIAYADAVVGYLRLMVEGGPGAARSRVHGWMEAAFREYEEAVGRDAAPGAQALSRSLIGLALWSDPEKRADAARLFREALDFAPSAAEARVLAAVTTPALSGQRADAGTLAQLDRALLGALAVDPASATALGNLERLYAFETRRASATLYPAEELETRLAAVKSAPRKR